MTAHDTGRRAWRDPWHLAMALALCAVAGVLRFAPLGPSSLWLDDAWVALVSKTSGLADTFMVGLTGPGFAFLLKGWLALVGFSETAAQLPAFTFGVAAPGLLYLVAVARGFSFAGAFVAGGLLVASPVHVVYSTRVKHYTLDVVLAIVLIALAWRVLDAPRSTRRWVWLAVVACLAVVMSGGVAAMAAGAMGAAFLASVRAGGRARVAVAASAAWAVVALGWYVAVLRPAVTPAIRGYWADRYVGSFGDLRAGVAGLLEGFSAGPSAGAAVLVVAGVVVLARHRPLVVVLLLAPVAGLALLSVMGLAPLGGGRTDAFAYPALALLVGAAADGVARWRATVGVALAAMGVAAAVAGTGLAPPYPLEDVRPLVAEADARRRPGEPLLVYPSTMWAYALYTGEEVDLVRSDNPWGFAPTVNDADVVLLEARRDAPQLYAPQVDAAVHGADRAWLLSSHHRPDLRVIHAALRASGLAPQARWQREGALLWSWHRR